MSNNPYGNPYVQLSRFRTRATAITTAVTAETPTRGEAATAATTKPATITTPTISDIKDTVGASTSTEATRRKTRVTVAPV